MTRPQPSEVWRCGALDGTQKLVLLAILDYGRLAYPRQAVLAAKCGISRSTCQRALDQLRVSGVLTTSSRGKALVYRINLTGEEMPQLDASRSIKMTQEKHQDDASTGVKMTQGSELVQLTSPPNQQTATAVSGWEVQSDTANRIKQRDPRADLDAQRSVCRRVLISYGLSDRDAVGAWRLLLEHWARSGNDAYATLKHHTENLGGARDVAKVVLHRLQGVA
jgi:biotin operon repressor